ncbi:hypothetical protein D3C80_1775140 [compost metagenome]
MAAGRGDVVGRLDLVEVACHDEGVVLEVIQHFLVVIVDRGREPVGGTIIVWHPNDCCADSGVAARQGDHRIGDMKILGHLCQRQVRRGDRA